MLVSGTGKEGEDARVQTVPFAPIPLLKVWLWWRTGGRTAKDMAGDWWCAGVMGYVCVCVCARMRGFCIVRTGTGYRYPRILLLFFLFFFFPPDLISRLR